MLVSFYTYDLSCDKGLLIDFSFATLLTQNLVYAGSVNVILNVYMQVSENI